VVDDIETGFELNRTGSDTWTIGFKDGIVPTHPNGPLRNRYNLSLELWTAGTFTYDAAGNIVPIGNARATTVTIRVNIPDGHNSNIISNIFNASNAVVEAPKNSGSFADYSTKEKVVVLPEEEQQVEPQFTIIENEVEEDILFGTEPIIIENIETEVIGTNNIGTTEDDNATENNNDTGQVIVYSDNVLKRDDAVSVLRYLPLLLFVPLFYIAVKKTRNYRIRKLGVSGKRR
jgi:hypothetical protein